MVGGSVRWGRGNGRGNGRSGGEGWRGSVLFKICSKPNSQVAEPVIQAFDVSTHARARCRTRSLASRRARAPRVAVAARSQIDLPIAGSTTFVQRLIPSSRHVALNGFPETPGGG